MKYKIHHIYFEVFSMNQHLLKPPASKILSFRIPTEETKTAAKKCKLWYLAVLELPANQHCQSGPNVGE